MTEFTTIEANRYGSFSVFQWDTWPSGSLLAGQNRKRYVAGYATEQTARERFPEAEESTAHRDPCNTFNHLPGEDDPVTGGMYLDDIGFADMEEEQWREWKDGS